MTSFYTSKIYINFEESTYDLIMIMSFMDCSTKLSYFSFILTIKLQNTKIIHFKICIRFLFSYYVN